MPTWNSISSKITFQKWRRNIFSDKNQSDLLPLDPPCTKCQWKLFRVKGNEEKSSREGIDEDGKWKPNCKGSSTVWEHWSQLRERKALFCAGHPKASRRHSDSTRECGRLQEGIEGCDQPRVTASFPLSSTFNSSCFFCCLMCYLERKRESGDIIVFSSYNYVNVINASNISPL